MRELILLRNTILLSEIKTIQERITSKKEIKGSLNKTLKHLIAENTKHLLIFAPKPYVLTQPIIMRSSYGIMEQAQ